MNEMFNENIVEIFRQRYEERVRELNRAPMTDETGLVKAKKSTRKAKAKEEKEMER